jgi:hypothetical protein
MNPNFKAVLLTVLTLSVFTLVIIELTGVSSNSLNALMHSKKEASSAPPGMSADPNADPRMEKLKILPKTTMKFEETTFNFGTIPDNKEVKHVYKFKNTGVNPLFIAKADVSCGCTVPSFSKEPIAPGADGELTVTFNPKGKSGAQHKNIIVHSNAELEAVSINFDADVK